MNKNKQTGAVSLFIVIFTTLLVSIITVSFVRIMLSDQRQASAADLSQSAYDSALAGVEDAKRALIDYQTECASGDATRCSTAIGLIDSSTCNQALSRIMTVNAGQEIMVQQTPGDNALQQAYTCVKVIRQTDDYLGTLAADDSKIIPLKGIASFDAIHIEWFSIKDHEGAGTLVDVPNEVASPGLVTQDKWAPTSAPNRPPIMRTQLMQFGSGFTLGDFEDVDGSGKSNANTLFLYPSKIADTTRFFTDNARKVNSGAGLVQIHCATSLSGGGYACGATVGLPTPINGGDRTAYLRLTSLYKKSNYRVTLLNGGAPVKFDSVQPEVDSTGRANDLFRRVQSRVELIDENFPYPEAAVDSSQTLCKDFLVTDQASDYANKCTP